MRPRAVEARRRNSMQPSGLQRRAALPERLPLVEGTGTRRMERRAGSASASGAASTESYPDDNNDRCSTIRFVTDTMSV